MHLRIKGSCNPFKDCLRIFEVPYVLLIPFIVPSTAKAKTISQKTSRQQRWSYSTPPRVIFVVNSISDITSSSTSISSWPHSIRFSKWWTSSASIRPGQKLFSADMVLFCPMMSFALIAILSVGKKASVSMKSSSRPLLHQRAERMCGYVRGALPAIYSAIWFGPNRQRRAEARQFLDEIVKEFGSLSFKKRLECWGTLSLSFWTWMKESLA